MKASKLLVAFFGISLSASAVFAQGGEQAYIASVPAQKATAEVIPLTMNDALDRGLKHNLRIILSEQDERSSKGARLRALSDLLPKVNFRSGESIQKINLAAFGFPRQPGVPEVVGPFSVFDARGAVTAPLLDLKSLNNTRSSNELVKATEYAYDSTRETVVLVVADLYLEALAAQARVEAAKSQFTTAETVFKQATDLKKNGVAAGIDVLRAQVQMQTRQSQQIAAENEFEKRKLNLARAIGFDPAQKFTLADRMPEAPVNPITIEQVLDDANRNRPDLKRANALVASAELSKKSAISEALPTIRFNGDYGAIGRAPGNARGTFTAAVGIDIPIFQGGRVAGKTIEADALLKQRRAEAEDLKARIEAEVREYFLDVQTAARQLAVAKSSVQLANQQLEQARDRFAAGVAGTLEVVQSEEALAAAQESLIASQYGFNVARAQLARSAGVAERSVKEFLGAQGEK